MRRNFPGLFLPLLLARPPRSAHLSRSVRVQERVRARGGWGCLPFERLRLLPPLCEAARPCRQGRSLETDTPGVCSSSPPLSIHTHPPGSALLPLSFRTYLLLSEQKAHEDFVKELI